MISLSKQFYEMLVSTLEQWALSIHGARGCFVHSEQVTFFESGNDFGIDYKTNVLRSRSSSFVKPDNSAVSGAVRTLYPGAGGRGGVGTTGVEYLHTPGDDTAELSAGGTGGGGACQQLEELDPGIPRSPPTPVMIQ